MINSQKTLVAYLDIMGYREIINNKPPHEFYCIIDRSFKDMQFIKDSLCNNEAKGDSPATTNEKVIELFKSLGFKILSDTIIIYYNLDDIEKIDKDHYTKLHDEFHATTIFFSMVATFVLNFISISGYLLRGGICLGKFYTNNLATGVLNGDFIFSEAFVRGYELEQMANHPRILVDEHLYNSWESRIDKARYNDMFKAKINRDRDGKLYLDYFEFVRTVAVSGKKALFGEITKQINNMLVAKQDNKRIWKKWHWFKEYHNEKIRSFAESENQDLNELLID
jgi:hypothetical protein